MRIETIVLLVLAGGFLGLVLATVFCWRQANTLAPSEAGVVVSSMNAEKTVAHWWECAARNTGLAAAAWLYFSLFLGLACVLGLLQG